MGVRSNEKKYVKFLECSEDIINYLLYRNERTLELIETIVENVYMSNELDIKAFFKEDNLSEKIEILMVSINKLSSSEFLKRKKVYVDIKKKMHKLNSINYEQIQAKYQTLLEKDEEVIKKFKANQL